MDPLFSRIWVVALYGMTAGLRKCSVFKMRAKLENSQRKFDGANSVCNLEESERALRR
jgi:hypothetical protein